MTKVQPITLHRLRLVVAAVLVLGVAYTIFKMMFPVKQPYLYPVDDLPAGLREVFQRSTISGNSQEFRQVEFVFASAHEESVESMQNRFFEELVRKGWDFKGNLVAVNPKGSCLSALPLADHLAQAEDDRLQRFREIQKLLYVAVGVC